MKPSSIRLDPRAITHARMLALIWQDDPNDPTIVRHIIEECVTRQFHDIRVGMDAKFVVEMRVENDVPSEWISLDGGGEFKV